MQSGIQIMRINTIFQLYSLKLNRSEFLNSAKTLLMVPDLLAYMLTGAIRSEYTEATTTGLINPDTHDWNWELIDLIGINKDIFPPIIHSGDSYGLLSKEICDDIGITQCPLLLSDAMILHPLLPLFRRRMMISSTLAAEHGRYSALLARLLLLMKKVTNTTLRMRGRK